MRDARTPAETAQAAGVRDRGDEFAESAAKLLVMAKVRVTAVSRTKLRGPLAASDPRGKVRDAWLAEEAVRGNYRVSAEGERSINCGPNQRQTVG